MKVSSYPSDSMKIGPYPTIALSKFRKDVLRNVNHIVKKHLNKTVIDGFGLVGARKRIKTFRLSIDDGTFLRFDIKYVKAIARLQMLAVENGIELPRVILCVGKYKFSEWIDGVVLKEVSTNGHAYVKCGEVMARLNNVKDPVQNAFLANADMGLTNFVWTKDKKIYIIDHGKLKTTEDPDISVCVGLRKRFLDKGRIDAFLKGYSKYRNIDRIMKLLEKSNWSWPGKKFTIDRGPIEF